MTAALRRRALRLRDSAAPAAEGPLPARARLALQERNGEDAALDEDSALEEQTVLASGSLVELQRALQAMDHAERDPALDEATQLHVLPELGELELAPDEALLVEEDPSLAEASEVFEVLEALDPADFEELDAQAETEPDLPALTLSWSAAEGADPEGSDAEDSDPEDDLQEETVLVDRAELEALLALHRGPASVAVAVAVADPVLDEETVVLQDDLEEPTTLAEAHQLAALMGSSFRSRRPGAPALAGRDRLQGGVAAFPLALAPSLVGTLLPRRGPVLTTDPLLGQSFSAEELVAPALLPSPSKSSVIAFPRGGARAARRAWARQALA